ncbi:MAG: hypothetical protein Roseis2KO_41760 [Roseivirga sp.]
MGIDAPSRQSVFTPVKKNWFASNKVQCPTCSEETNKLVCPHCHNNLPRDFQEDKPKKLAIAGDTYAGKSLFITVLIQELTKRNITIPFGLNITKEGDHTSRRYNRDFYEPLYVEKRFLDATPYDDPDTKLPLMFRMSRDKDIRMSSGVPSSVYLSFYDRAGEEFLNEDWMAAELRYIANADGIVVLIDPLQLDLFREFLEDKMVLPPKRDRHLDIVKNIHRLVCDKLRVKVDTRLDVPIAICMTKMDYFYEYGKEIIDVNSRFTKKASYSSDMEITDAELTTVSTEIESLLTDPRLGDESNFVSFVRNHFSNYTFLGVSSLGEVPEDEDSFAIKPRRVTDPIVWILRQFKFL